ncbi:transposase [Paraburkholderia sp. GAS333]|uniref:transposase n=1 Tax=Paraburkholderia sp. GAS333 TaxID=3156279 RepID=UPI003D2424B7
MNRLSDVEWACIQHLFSQPGAQKATGRPAADSRAVIDAILWIERTGERWMYLPTHFPPQQTCYARYLTWKRNGVLEQVRALLAESPAGAGEHPALRKESDLIETV